MNLILDFWLNGYLFLALARVEAMPLTHALKTQPIPPDHAQYAIWLHNHDELFLDLLDASERTEVMHRFGPDPIMPAYDRGIRRRCAPMLGGDERRLAQAHALLFSLPGVPIVRYGEEIGMGDNLSLLQREAVRTPMQWSTEDNGGFSTAPISKLAAPVITDGQYAFTHINVYNQILRHDPYWLKLAT